MNLNPMLSGAAILDAPSHVPAVWGSGDRLLWSQGEPLILAGPPGVGKSTLAQQLVLARACVPADLKVLGHLVTPDPSSRTLYVAADRPQQVLRSMRRMVEPHHRQDLEDRLLIWAGPFDLLGDPSGVVESLIEEEVGTIVFDSIKDVAGDVSDGQVGAAFNRAVQRIVAAEVEVLAVHHNRKSQDKNPKPTRLDDLYGSTWLAAGAGSVVSLWGEAGDRVVELRHLKQPAETVGPLTIVHDHSTGQSAATGGDASELIEAAASGITVKQAAQKMFATSDPATKQIETARRRLKGLATEGKIIKRHEGASPKAPTTYWAAQTTPENVVDRDGSRDRSRLDHAEAEDRLSKDHDAITARYAEGPDGGTPLKGGRGPDREAEPTLEDALLDPERAEQIRAAVDGECLDGEGAESCSGHRS